MLGIERLTDNSFITENKVYRNKKDQKKCTWLTTK